MNYMNYNDLKNTNDEDLIKFINTAMAIYKNLKEKKLKYKRYEKYSLFPYQTKKLSDNDKKCVALFLTGILYKANICNLFNQNNINTKKVLKYFKLKGKNELVGYITITDKEKYYSNNFEFFINKIIRNTVTENFDLDQDLISSESIFLGLKDSEICGSDIIENLFNHFKLVSRKSYKFEHQIFDDIKEMAIQKHNQKIKQKEYIEEVVNIETNHDNYKTESYNQITKYGIDLNDNEYITNPALGREKEINELMAGLLIDNSVILTGDSAVGKSAIVEGLAYQIQNKNVHENLQNSRIIKINTSTLISGTRYRGTLEEKLEEIFECLMDDKNLILFLDEIHTTIGAGESENSSLDISNMLKPYLDRGQIKIIGTTTTQEYEKYIARDNAFKRRFERVIVKELDENVIKEILNNIIYKMEKTTNIKFNLNHRNIILDIIIDLTKNKHRIQNDKINNPDLSIKIIKKAFAYAMLDKNEKVQIDNIITSILNHDRIYDSVKERYIKQLKNIDNNSNLDINNNCKIIEFEKIIR